MVTNHGTNTRTTLSLTAALLIGGVLAPASVGLADGPGSGLTIFDDFIPNGMAPDGRTLVGRDPFLGKPATWSPEGGIELLPVHCDTDSGEGRFISENGTALGVMTGCEMPSTSGVRWDGEDLPYVFGPSGGYVVALSPDASAAVGRNSFTSRSYRWTSDDGWSPLLDLFGGLNLHFAFDCSADGSVLVGFGVDAEGWKSVRWLDGSALPVALPPLDPDDPGAERQLRAVSDDGSIVAGYEGNWPDYVAFTWSEATGYTVIPGLSGIDQLAADGSWAHDREAIHHAGVGTVPFIPWLEDRGFTLPETGDSDTIIPISLSEDQRAVYGVVDAADGVDVWFHSRLPDSCLGDLDGSGDVDFSDVLSVLGNWGGAGGDVDGDGTTDFADVLAVLAAWGPCPG